MGTSKTRSSHVKRKLRTHARRRRRHRHDSSTDTTNVVDDGNNDNANESSSDEWDLDDDNGESTQRPRIRSFYKLRAQYKSSIAEATNGGTENEQQQQQQQLFEGGTHAKHFVYLIVNAWPGTKTHTYVGKGKRPLFQLYRHNNGLIPKARSTRPAKGHWWMEMIIGPIDSREKAVKIRDKWKAHSRGAKPRREKGMTIAIEHNLTCWDRRLNPELSSNNNDMKVIHTPIT